MGITAAQVEQIIQQGIDTAAKTRAQIRTPTAQMIFSVTDTTGEVVGMYRMTDSTIFSIDISVAKARNVSYYASADLQDVDRVPVNDLLPVSVTNPYLPLGTAFTNRTVRFLADPRYPEAVNHSVPGYFSIFAKIGSTRATATTSAGRFRSPTSIQFWATTRSIQAQTSTIPPILIIKTAWCFSQAVRPSTAVRS